MSRPASLQTPPAPATDDPVTTHTCCGGAAPAGTGACCARDADAKASGRTGCGCASPSAAGSPARSICC